MLYRWRLTVRFDHPLLDRTCLGQIGQKQRFRVWKKHPWRFEKHVFWHFLLALISVN
jgi:hypothetical protein